MAYPPFTKSVQVRRVQPTMEVEGYHRHGNRPRPPRPACEPDDLTYEEARARAASTSLRRPFCLTVDGRDHYLRVWKKVPFKERHVLVLCTRDEAHAHNYLRRSAEDY